MGHLRVQLVTNKSQGLKVSRHLIKSAFPIKNKVTNKKMIKPSKSNLTKKYKPNAQTVTLNLDVPADTEKGEIRKLPRMRS